MAHRYRVPAEQVRVEFEVQNSRFIATLAPAFTVDEAKAFIKTIKAEFKDASHNVPAFVIGHGASTTAHAHDDGEPSGTAGRPALAVLQGSDLGDAVVVVTRYFGGKKLGKGGLVRAYGDAVREVLKVAPLAERVPTHTVMIPLHYRWLENARRLIDAHNGEILDEDFGVDVTLTVRFTIEGYPAFRDEIFDKSHGQIEAMIIETNEGTLMPIQPDN